jgi:hypothetical protein
LPENAYLDRGGNPNDEGQWFSEDGKYVARLPAGDRTVHFYSHANRREVARLELPAPSCIGEKCNFEITFLDHSRRAVVSNRDSSDTATGRIFGVVSLDPCGFDAWQEVGPISLLSDQLPHGKGKSWQVHRVSSHVASRTETHIAALMTLIGDRYQDVGVIFGIKERRPVALFFPHIVDPDALSINALQAVDGDFAFLAWTDRGIVPVRADGTLGAFHRAGTDGTSASGQNAREPAQWRFRSFVPDQSNQVPHWISDTHNVSESAQWHFPSGDVSKTPALIDAYGGKISTLAVSADSVRLALAQSGVIFVQPATPDAFAKVVTIKTVAQKYDAIRFSPDSRVLAAAWTATWEDNAPYTLSVWSSATGELIAERAQDSVTRLLAVGDDASVFIEKSEYARWLNLKTGETKPITQMRHERGRMVWRGSQLLADDGNGHLLAVEPKTLNVAPLTSFVGRLVDVSPDGRTAYSSMGFSSGYFVNFSNARSQQFLSNTGTGVSWFFRSGKLALATGGFIDVWDPVGPERVARYTGSWEGILAVWLSANDHELWALDSRGLLFRWNLAESYSAIVASACETLRDSGAPLEFSNDQMAAFPQLSWSDRKPCSRAGLLSVDYYIQFLNRLIAR